MIGNLLFLAIVMAVGFVIKLYFDRMKNRYRDFYPKEKKNPVSFWLTGRDDDDD